MEPVTLCWVSDEKNVRKASGDCEEGGYVSLTLSFTGTALQSAVLQ